jgi:hypothetical protein
MIVIFQTSMNVVCASVMRLISFSPVDTSTIEPVFSSALRGSMNAFFAGGQS